MSWNVLVAGTKRAILAHIESKQPDTWDECARRIMTEAVLNLQDGSTYVLKSQGHLDTYGGQATLEVVRAQILSEPESLSTAPPVWRPPELLKAVAADPKNKDLMALPLVIKGQVYRASASFSL